MAVPNDAPAWLSWVAPVVTALAAGWAVARRLLVSVTREELRQSLQDMQQTRLEMHTENLAKFDQLFKRLGEVEKTVSRVEGQLSGRFPRLNP